MDYRKLFRDVRSRPSSYGFSGDDGEAVAFAMGCDAGNDRGVLAGFPERLALKHRTGANLAWLRAVAEISAGKAMRIQERSLPRKPTRCSGSSTSSWRKRPALARYPPLSPGTPSGEYARDLQRGDVSAPRRPLGLGRSERSLAPPTCRDQRARDYIRIPFMRTTLSATIRFSRRCGSEVKGPSIRSSLPMR